jgi:signal transduction histidine kinase
VGTPVNRRFFPSLRARFAVLLVALAVLAVGPSSIWAMCDLGTRSLARERVEALARQLTRLADDAEEPALHDWHRRHTTVAAHEHQALLTAVVEPVACSELEAEACDALLAYKARWDRELAPLLQGSALPAPALGGRLRTEAQELDRIADLASRSLRTRADQVRRLATAVSALSIFLVGLVAFGVWEVFNRVRRIRASTLSPSAESELDQHGERPDELGGLARSLARALEESRARRERDAERLTLLATHQRALEQFAQKVNDWLAGADTLDTGLSEVAELCGYDAIRLDRSPAGAEQPTVPGRHRICWRGRFLGTLQLDGRSSESFPEERARLVETLVQLVSLGCMARHLLAEREQYSALTRSLSSLASLDVGATDLDARLRSLIDFDIASLLLMDEAARGEQCLILEHGQLARAPAECRALPPETAEIHEADEPCTCPELTSRGATQILAIPLRVGSQLIGVLQLGRRDRPFSDHDLAMVATLESLIGPGLARIRLQDRLRWLYQSNALHGFARLLSHELKNPLNSSSLQLETLARRTDRVSAGSADRALIQASIDAMRSELERLGRVVDEQLDLLRTGGLDPIAAEVDLNQLAREVIDEQLDQIQQQGLTLELALSQYPAQIVGSRGKLRLLIKHLLSNAVESMQSSRVRNLMITTRDGGEFWDLVVRDTGCGIPDPLEIFSAGYTTKPSGTGMGLAVSLHIAREHGGRLTARRAADGSELVLSLAKTAPICSSVS